MRSISVDNDARLQILLTIYQEVASHLRATDDKRDRLFDIYVTIVLAVTSGLVLLRLSTAQPSVDAIALSLILVFLLLIFGETTSFAMIGARKWHAEYVNCFIILHAMMSKNIYEVRSDLVSLQERHPFTPAIHTNREFILAEAGIVGTYLMSGNLLASTQMGSTAYMVMGTAALITIVINYLAAKRILHQAEERFWKDPKSSWVFSGLVFSSNGNGEVIS